MELTRNANHKSKRLCIFISKETEKDGGVLTTIDHVGDAELLDDYKKSLIQETLNNLTFNP